MLRRRALFAVVALLLLLPHRAEAAYTLCAHVETGGFGANGGTSGSINTASNANCSGNPADLIVVVISEYGGGTPGSTPTDSQGNSYTKCGLTETNASSSSVTIWYKQSPSTSTTHTFTYTVTSSYPAIMASAWTGSAASPCDQTNQNKALSTTSLATNSITPTNNSLVISGMSDGAGTSYGVTTLTSLDTLNFATNVNMGGAHAYIVSGGSAVNPTWSATGAGDMAASIVSFKPFVGGGPPLGRATSGAN